MAVERSINLPTGPVAIVPASLARCAAVGVLGLLGGFATIVVARRAAGRWNTHWSRAHSG